MYIYIRVPAALRLIGILIYNLSPEEVWGSSFDPLGLSVDPFGQGRRSYERLRKYVFQLVPSSMSLLSPSWTQHFRYMCHLHIASMCTYTFPYIHLYIIRVYLYFCFSYMYDPGSRVACCKPPLPPQWYGPLCRASETLYKPRFPEHTLLWLQRKQY